MVMRTQEQLAAGLENLRPAPADDGRLALIVRRPDMDEREPLERGRLDFNEGLVGDGWIGRPSSKSGDGGPHLDAQLTLIATRAAALFAGSEDHRAWAQAGDQLYVELDLSTANLPAGARLAIGGAVIEVTAEPHLGCGKFARRFGVDALKLVNSEAGRALRLRGLNARVIEAGDIAVGDPIRKLDWPA